MKFKGDMDKYTEIKRRMLEYAVKDDDIKAIAAIGSSTRKDQTADEYSDLDLFVVTNDTEKWYSGEYPQRFGKVNISFIEPTLGSGRERRCIYDEDKDVDMLIFTPEHFESIVRDGTAEWVMNRGYEVLYDSMGCTELLRSCIKPVVKAPAISEEEFINTVNIFYFHDIWALKKLRRGELWSAKMCVDQYMKQLLLRMLELYCHKSKGADIWHDGRFLEKWVGDDILAELGNCFAHYDTKDVSRALAATHSLFSRITEELAELEGFVYPHQARDCADSYIRLTQGNVK